jgi:hypothetical protein
VKAIDEDLPPLKQPQGANHHRSIAIRDGACPDCDFRLAFARLVALLFDEWATLRGNYGGPIRLNNGSGIVSKQIDNLRHSTSISMSASRDFVISA